MVFDTMLVEDPRDDVGYRAKDLWGGPETKRESPVDIGPAPP